MNRRTTKKIKTKPNPTGLTRQAKNNGFPTELISEPQDKLAYNQLLSHLLHIEAKDITLKWVFDHIRNYIICGVVFWAGIRAFKIPKQSYIDSFSYSIGGVVLIFGSVLFFSLNMLHGIVGYSKIRNLGTIRKASYLIGCFIMFFSAQILYITAKSS
ncbi:hypothetical protein BK666_07145 [Pseudomonas frederiksbergensis]|uniref:Uncharacterized protein n=1 Tax=Pseudomonas frederiksbergensis TaxID=104087 RepID=A0A423KBB7_9PSED|nr:hypothetical protein [Pseudomonas frederiksbergensis]RON49344.1 hypothetical protein BK666_07145 [Pseudomonas frederiksbergensis]